MHKRTAFDVEREDGALGLQEGTPAKRSRVGSTEAELSARKTEAIQNDGSSEPLFQEPNQTADTDARIQTQDKSDEIDDDDADQFVVGHTRQAAPNDGFRDLYLDTINRAVLDFDFEKLCSATLTNINVYSCLICGKYFQGRGPRSPAYFHALDEDHHVWINMQTQKVYVLPEGYEVQSGSLDDIKYVVDPTYTRQEVARLDRRIQADGTTNNIVNDNGNNKKSATAVTTTFWDLQGRSYTPGFVGLNNIKANDYVNVIVHALAHVRPLRNYFMLEDLRSRSELAQRFGVLARKIWNSRAFKAHVSPHELLQAITDRSRKRFTLTVQSDPADLLLWLVNELHTGLGGSRTKAGSSIIHRIFQGRMLVESEEIGGGSAGSKSIMKSNKGQPGATGTSVPTLNLPSNQKQDGRMIQPFVVLTLELPATPLFADEIERNIIPQVALTKLLSKYDGTQVQETERQRRKFRLLKPLPPFLILHIKRFSANRFVEERNRTIVTFNPRGLDMNPYAVSERGLNKSDEKNSEMDVDENGDETEKALGSKPDGEEKEEEEEEEIYDMVANITHEGVKTRDDSVSGEMMKKVWSVQLLDKSRQSWVEVQDLFVSPAASETLFTRESYIQVWERRQPHK